MLKVTDLTDREIMEIEVISNILGIDEPNDEDDYLLTFLIDVKTKSNDIKSQLEFLTTPKRRTLPKL